MRRHPRTFTEARRGAKSLEVGGKLFHMGSKRPERKRDCRSNARRKLKTSPLRPSSTRKGSDLLWFEISTTLRPKTRPRRKEPMHSTGKCLKTNFKKRGWINLKTIRRSYELRGGPLLTKAPTGTAKLGLEYSRTCANRKKSCGERKGKSRQGILTPLGR